MKQVKSIHTSNIDWCTHTCNIITGCLGPAGDGNTCPYCYAEPFSHRIYRKPLGEGNEFKPHFWEERLPGIAKDKSCRIFMNSMGDAFGDWVPKEWIHKMLVECSANPDNVYYFLTKNPKRYFEDGIVHFFETNENFWMGFTAETGSLYHERFQYYIDGTEINIRANMRSRPNFFASIEPMFDGSHTLSWNGIRPDWVITGAQTKPDRYPSPAWIENIRQQCSVLNIPLFEKNSLAPMNLEGGLIQEIPD